MAALKRVRTGVFGVMLGTTLASACGDSDDPVTGSSPSSDASALDGAVSPSGDGDGDGQGGSPNGDGDPPMGDGDPAGDGDPPVGDGDGDNVTDGGDSEDDSGVLLDASIGGGDAGIDASSGGGGDGDASADAGNQCTTIDPAVTTHVAAMATQGWAAVNASNSIIMHGCAAAATPLDCLSSYPRANTTVYGATWENDLAAAKLRILRVNDYSSVFWTRSSPDGRFVAHGSGGGTAAFIDLVGNNTINADAYYDPGFFPDNSGFMMQKGEAEVCRQVVLTSLPSTITFNESGCTNISAINLSQHLGAHLSDGNYFSVHGQFESDNGGHSATLSDPEASYSSGSSVTLVPLIYNGTRFEERASLNMALPGEGDFVISPSGTLLMSRAADLASKQDGYRLRKLDLTPVSNTYTPSLSDLAHYCVRGGVPSFSYDERWVVLHHYIDALDAADMGFDTGVDAGADGGAELYSTYGSANVYLLELATGELTRITRMNPGQYALYPHFRSDGWIYFMVRTLGSNTEYLVASDAALVLGQ